MKKILSILITMAFIFGITGTVFAAQKAVVSKAPVVKPVTAVGQVKYFTDKTITLGVNGKNSVYTYDASTKVALNGEISEDLLSVVNKGVPAAFTALGTKLQAIDLGQIGDQAFGSLIITATNVRNLKTDSSAAAAKNTATTTTTKTESGKETDTLFAYGEDGDNVVALGTIDILPGTVKVTLNGKDIKVIDSKATFDKTVVGDEAQLFLDPDDENMSKLRFEKAIFENASTTQEDAEKALVISYDKKIYNYSTTEVLPFGVDESVYCELNGKEVSLPVALNRGNYATLILSPKSTISYINAFYKDLACTVVSVKGDKLTISVDVKGKTAFKDTLTITDLANIHDATGAQLSLSDLMAKDAIKITVDPDSGYSVNEISKLAN